MSDPMPAKPNDFIVRLDGLHLDEKTRNRIAGAIQAAVLAELGKIDVAGPQPSSGFAIIPIRWRGIWLREAVNLAQSLGEMERPLGVTER